METNLNMYSSISVANYFIEKSFDEGFIITPMKVLKLVYIAHGWHLGITGNPLITEQTEAWKYGPVVPSVYHTYKFFGSNDINEIIIPNNQIRSDFKLLCSDKFASVLLDKVWEEYKIYSGLQLSDMTHRENTPWEITWNKNHGSKLSGAIIPNNLIQKHYSEKLQLSNSDA